MSSQVSRAKLVELDAMGAFVVREAEAPAPQQLASAAPAKPRRWWPR